MKKILCTITILTSVFSIAQKDELKTLKKIAANDKIVAEDMQTYTATLSKVETLVVSDEDKNSVSYYKGIKAIKELSQFGFQPSKEQIAKIFTPQNIITSLMELKKVLDYETKSGKKVYTDEIEKLLILYKPMLIDASFALNEAKRYKEASEVFYAWFQFDSLNYMYLENAAVLAQLAEDFLTSEKYYKEIQKIGFDGTGTQVFKTSKKDVANIIASFAFYRKDYEQAKNDYAYLVSLDPSDLQAQVNEANCYYFLNDLTTYKTKISAVLAKDPNNATLQFNVGYLMLSDDAKLVEEINANLKNDKKYNELTAKRKEMFKNAMPYFEKSYQLDASNADCKAILKTCYEILGMKDKAATLK